MGPWGGNGGAAWDDGNYDGVREITLVHGRCIDSIRIVYDKNGKPFPGEKHGGAGGNRTTEVAKIYYAILEFSRHLIHKIKTKSSISNLKLADHALNEHNIEEYEFDSHL